MLYHAFLEVKMKQGTIGKLETIEPALRAGRGSDPKEAMRTGKWLGTTAHAVVPSRKGNASKTRLPRASAYGSCLPEV